MRGRGGVSPRDYCDQIWASVFQRPQRAIALRAGLPFHVAVLRAAPGAHAALRRRQGRRDAGTLRRGRFRESRHSSRCLLLRCRAKVWVLRSQGVVIWIDQELQTRRVELEDYVARKTGPDAARLLRRVNDCAASNCGGHGRCQPLESGRCVCSAGWRGVRCNESRRVKSDDDHTTCLRFSASTADDSAEAVVVQVAAELADEVNSRLPTPSWSTDCDDAATTSVRLSLGTSEATACGGLPRSPGSFVLDAYREGLLRVQAADAEGLRSAAGRLLRELRMPPRFPAASDVSASVAAPSDLCVRHDASAALWHVRGHQMSVDYHPMQLRTRAAFQRFASDLRAFGTNALEMAHLASMTTARWLTASCSSRRSAPRWG